MRIVKDIGVVTQFSNLAVDSDCLCGIGQVLLFTFKFLVNGAGLFSGFRLNTMLIVFWMGIAPRLRFLGVSIVGKWLSQSF